MRRDYLGEWFAIIDRLHYTPKWRWRKRRRLNAMLDEIERNWY